MNDFKEKWLAFLWSFSLSEDMGEAMDDVIAISKILEINIPDDIDSFGDLREWIKGEGYDEDKSQSLWDYLRRMP